MRQALYHELAALRNLRCQCVDLLRDRSNTLRLTARHVDVFFDGHADRQLFFAVVAPVRSR